MNRTELELEAYCEGCEAIEPDVVKYSDRLCWSYDLNDYYPEPGKIVIMCKKRTLCANLYRHLKKQEEGKDVRSEE